MKGYVYYEDEDLWVVLNPIEIVKLIVYVLKSYLKCLRTKYTVILIA